MAIRPFCQRKRAGRLVRSRRESKQKPPSTPDIPLATSAWQPSSAADTGRRSAYPLEAGRPCGQFLCRICFTSSEANPAVSFWVAEPSWRPGSGDLRIRRAARSGRQDCAGQRKAVSSIKLLTRKSISFLPSSRRATVQWLRRTALP